MSALLLLHTSVEAAAAWVRRGVVAAHVAPAGDWTLVVPRTDRTAAQPPYDDPASVLLARPAGRLAPSMGAAVVRDTAVLTTQSPAFRALTRWAVRPRLGPVVRTAELTPLRPCDLTPLAGRGTTEGEVAGLFGRRNQPAHDWLADVLDLLGLPGAAVITDQVTPGRLVEPDEQAVATFEKVARESRL